jgi:hypothetical protein
VGSGDLRSSRRTTWWVAFCLLLDATFGIHAAEMRVALVIGSGA